MLAVGLTGGIGSGKSSVAALLVERGAVLVDADRVAREVVAPDGPAYAAVVDRFGSSVLLPDGTLDRPALAAIVFADSAPRADLEAITHPAIRNVLAARLSAKKGTDAVVVLDIPLLVPNKHDELHLDVVVVVDCPVELAVRRLVEHRGMTKADAEARVAAQISREERLNGADLVIDNSGSRKELADQMDGLWAELGSRLGMIDKNSGSW